MTDSALVARKLNDHQRIICAAPDLLSRLGEPTESHGLHDFPWVCLPWQTRIAFSDAKGRRRDATVRSSVLVSNSDTLTAAVVQGLGLAIKSRLAVRDELENGTLVEVSPGSLWAPDAPIWFVYPPEARSAVKTETLGKFLSRCFQEDFDGAIAEA